MQYVKFHTRISCVALVVRVVTWFDNRIKMKEETMMFFFFHVGVRVLGVGELLLSGQSGGVLVFGVWWCKCLFIYLINVFGLSSKIIRNDKIGSTGYGMQRYSHISYDVI